MSLLRVALEMLSSQVDPVNDRSQDTLLACALAAAVPKHNTKRPHLDRPDSILRLEGLDDARDGLDNFGLLIDL